MSVSVPSVQPVHAQAQTQPTAQPPKTAAQTATPQDKVTISRQAQQALTHSTTQAGGGVANHYGDSH